MASKEYHRKHYLENKDKYLKRAKAHNKIARKRNFEFIKEYKQTHYCIDCNQNNWIVLEFAHRSRKTKIDNISNLALCPVSLETLKKEIDKCDIRCANCHRIQTYNENN